MAKTTFMIEGPHLVEFVNNLYPINKEMLRNNWMYIRYTVHNLDYYYYFYDSVLNAYVIIMNAYADGGFDGYYISNDEVGKVVGTSSPLAIIDSEPLEKTDRDYLMVKFYKRNLHAYLENYALRYVQNLNHLMFFCNESSNLEVLKELFEYNNTRIITSEQHLDKNNVVATKSVLKFEALHNIKPVFKVYDQSDGEGDSIAFYNGSTVIRIASIHGKKFYEVSIFNLNSYPLCKHNVGILLASSIQASGYKPFVPSRDMINKYTSKEYLSSFTEWNGRVRSYYDPEDI